MLCRIKRFAESGLQLGLVKRGGFEVLIFITASPQCYSACAPKALHDSTIGAFAAIAAIAHWGHGVRLARFRSR